MPSNRLGAAQMRETAQDAWRWEGLKIDLSDAIATTEDLLERLRALDGAEPDEAPTREARRQRTRSSRELLLMQHLATKASVQIMDVYHGLKIRDEPAGHAEPAGDDAG